MKYEMYCPECGKIDKADEDGTCWYCGATIISPDVFDAISATARAEAIEQCAKRCETIASAAAVNPIWDACRAACAAALREMGRE